jgi:hypothetical protein
MGKRGVDGKYWKPTKPGCVCKECGATFTGRVRNPQYCSKSCSSKATWKFSPFFTNKTEHTERECPGCKKKWSAPASNPSTYCSKQCLFDSGRWAHPRMADCEDCGEQFLSRPRATRGQWERFCSRECANKALRLPDKECANCGKVFHGWGDRPNEKVCSIECRTAYYIRDRSHGWKGGKVLQGGRKFRRIDRDGYVANYEGEHRLVAARGIGRPLRRGEVVICLDGNNANFDPSNLFICPNMRENGLIQSGAVEWPSKSNLEDYRVSGYIRPSVILTLHEWENNKRPGQKGKWISRHPQADEIIKRRKAGATVRELAKEFGQSVSTMAATVRTRL